MRKWFFIPVLILLAGCAVTSEEFRYKQRFDAYWEFLNDEEKAMFAEDDLSALGASLDERIAADEELSNNYYQIKIYESVMTYGNDDVARLFREYILRELNRNQFYDFMDFFDSEEQAAFAKSEGFMDIINTKENEDRKFRRFMDDMKTDYRLYGFSSEQVVNFFHDVSFPEVSRKQVYYLLDFLKSAPTAEANEAIAEANEALTQERLDELASLNEDAKQLIEMGYTAALSDYLADLDYFEEEEDPSLYQAFLLGNSMEAAELIKEVFKSSSGYSLKKEFNGIKDLSGLGNTDIETFLNIYYTVVFVEMDQEALQKTLEKF